MVRGQFSKNKNEKDEAKIEMLKAGAIRALSNYMLYESGAKDEKLGKAMRNFNENTRKEIQSDDRSSAENNDPSKSQ
eukprot:CAMPEP_0203648384 /NCGR_PEP_ID=MMETSP0088-20131115/18679_1 /ASSEMBLY_ACC=CAM_ASM_001087 /TAXON_ID=426623 /ORGANISM="Chaetoceros affinis, Strain CCMP159" /LENGTH=76 /DNA_ID=CAMNT_0050506371 /DNA_START=112 /DNA_END=342 /DNA_ORIENTATION=-